VATAGTLQMAGSLPRFRSDASLLGANASEGSDTGVTQKAHLLMSSLLDAKVTEKCATTINGRTKLAVLIMLPIFGIFLFMLILISLVMYSNRRSYVEYAIVVAGFLAWAPAWATVSGWLVFLCVPAAIVGDLIGQSTEKVRQTSHDRCNYDAVMRYIQRSHEVTTYLSALLSPTNSAITLLCFSFSVPCFVAMLAPRSNVDPESVVAWMLPDSLCQTQMLVMLCVARLQLLLPAMAASSECEMLLHAVGALRGRATQEAVVERGQGQAQDRRTEHSLASWGNLVRIDGILDYAGELNSSQGMGFTYRSRRVTGAGVWRQLSREAIALCSVFFIWSCYLDTDDMLVNETAANVTVGGL
jgi:hypothetical protein